MITDIIPGPILMGVARVEPLLHTTKVLCGVPKSLESPRIDHHALPRLALLLGLGPRIEHAWKSDSEMRVFHSLLKFEDSATLQVERRNLHSSVRTSVRTSVREYHVSIRSYRNPNAQETP